MKPKLIIIRGAPATGKTALAKGLVRKLKGKIALLTIDEFRWIMTAHNKRDKNDYDIAFKNYLYVLENYLKSDYTVVTEDVWLRKHKDESTDINKVIKLGKKYNAKIRQYLLIGKFETVKKINTLRPMVIPQKELIELYNKSYFSKIKEEVVVNIDNKKPANILKEVIKKLN